MRATLTEAGTKQQIYALHSFASVLENGDPRKPVLLIATKHEQLRKEVDTGPIHSGKEVAAFSAGMDEFDAIAVNQSNDGWLD